MIQSSQVNRYTNFINLLRLNFKLLTKSISFYVILAILFVEIGRASCRERV